MKKMLCMLLMLLLSMLVCFPSYANEPETLNLTQVHAYETATSLCFIEDTLYMLGAYGLYEYKENDAHMLKAISDYAKAADLGIEDMQFEINSKEVQKDGSIPDDISESIKAALIQFLQTLSETSNNSEVRLKMGEVKATSKHKGCNKNGESQLYSLDLEDESDGTRKLMSIAPAIESVLTNGGVLLVDGLERELHPLLVNVVISKFQSKKTNPLGAQIVFTTHDTELLNMELIRKDQLYFVDKNQKDGASELYSISEFGTRTTENIRKGYLLGKYGATPRC